MRRTSTWMCRLLGVLVACVLFAGGSARVASAQDALAEARSHYQKGTALFSAGDYKGAIGEYAAADKLAPSALLEFNIALCYDRMGDRAEALRRYRVYLREMPTAKNRSLVDSKVKRLEGEIREAQEAERRRRDEQAAAAAAAAAAAKPAPAPIAPAPVNPEDIVIPAATVPAAIPPAAIPPAATVPAAIPPATIPPATTGVTISSTPTPAAVYTPGGAAQTYAPVSAAVYESNDPELARVAAIDVAAIRNQRNATQGGASGFTPEPAPEPQGEASAAGEGAMPLVPTSSKDSKASKPIYKQWWFWTLAGIGTIIAIDMLSDDDSENSTSRLMLGAPMQSGAPSAAPLEWRF